MDVEYSLIELFPEMLNLNFLPHAVENPGTLIWIFL